MWDPVSVLPLDVCVLVKEERTVLIFHEFTLNVRALFMTEYVSNFHFEYVENNM